MMESTKKKQEKQGLAKETKTNKSLKRTNLNTSHNPSPLLIKALVSREYLRLTSLALSSITLACGK